MASAHAEIDLQNLVKNSPFGEGKAPGEKSGSLEFRGVYVDQGITYFNIYSPSTKSSTWIAQGETSTGPLNLAVKSYDETANTVIVENNGQAVKMVLHKSYIVPSESAAPAQAEARNAPALTTASANTPNSKEAKSNATPEQAQAFREQMRQRWSDRQNNDKGSTPNTANEKKKSESNGATDNSNNETKKIIVQ